MTVVHVPPGEATDVARKLLDAAAALGLDPAVVRTSSDGVYGFSLDVPEPVYWKAFGTEFSAEEPVAEDPPKRKGGRPRKATAPVDEVPEE